MIRSVQRIAFASEAEIGAIFSDCAPGAIPPVGAAYGLDTIIDDSIDDLQDVYLEGVERKELVTSPRGAVVETVTGVVVDPRGRVEDGVVERSASRHPGCRVGEENEEVVNIGVSFAKELVRMDVVDS